MLMQNVVAFDNSSECNTMIQNADILDMAHARLENAITCFVYGQPGLNKCIANHHRLKCQWTDHSKYVYLYGIFVLLK